MSAQHGHYTPEVHEHADDWHHHASEVEGMPQVEHGSVINTLTVGKWFVLIVLSVVATCAVLYLYFQHYATQYKAQQIENVSWSTDSAVYRARIEGELNGKPDWINHDYVRLPISDAMAKVVKDYQGKREPAEAATK